MSRWGKNMVVPLDSLCKEKEYTNRPTVARSVGTVGKWGKMGFTSTRTYSLSGLPAAVAAAAAAAAAAASPSQSPASAAMDDDMSPSVPEPPKPKKFFKSRNAAPPELIAQIIQHLPQAPTSPIGGEYGNTAITCTPNTPAHPGREPIKLKLPKSNSAEKKKKSPKKLTAKSAKVRGTENAHEDDMETATAAAAMSAAAKPPAEPKPKKKKEEKKLKPEAPPSRIISRARKAVNYCEDDDDERRITPYKEIIMPREPVSIISQPALPPPPPAAPVANASVGGVAPVANSVMQSVSAKTPEHPPIVLRISKGTSRLVSTDSEEQPTNTLTSPPQQQQHEANENQTTPPETSHHDESDGECDDDDTEAYATLPPKIIVKPPKPPSPQPTSTLLNEPNEINYCTVKISPDKPPKERLKLIIKTGVIRNAMAAEAAMATNATADKLLNESLSRGDGSETHRPEREKKSKSKKHKHPKHAAVEQLTPAQQASVTGSEFKTPSPHLALGALSSEQQAVTARTIISPPAMSERDFDSQSSVLGSISSKGNSTPSQPLAQAVQEESCVIHSRGSSVITSDLETSQHSSLVAPPSDIESRLESMMMDGEVSQRAIHLAEEEPLQEDILAVLRGDESQTAAVAVAASAALDVKMNGLTAELSREETRKEPETEAMEQDDDEADADVEEEANKRRVTRGRGRNAATAKSSGVDAVEAAATTAPETDVAPVPKVTARTTRGRKTVAATVTTAPTTPSKQAAVVEQDEATPTALNRRATRRAGKKANAEETTATIPVTASQELEEIALENNNSSSGAISPSHNKSSEEENNMNTPAQTAVQTTRRGRNTRNAANLNHNNINNNNINKIAANLSAKAGAAEEAKCHAANPATIATSAAVTPAQRSYGRKRKNQQVMQVLQPSAEELEEQHQQQPTPAKVANMGKVTEAAGQTAAASDDGSGGAVNSHGRANSSAAAASLTSPPRRDYKVKDKFKRTLTLDPQVNCNPIVAATAASSGTAGENAEEGEQRGSVKLVISKKKGSIFKSRALGPTDQSEQSTAAAKRRLYKHRWDAEANGVAGDDEVGDALRDTQDTPNAALRTGGDNVFDDFGDELGASGTSAANTRDNSPAIGKFTRVIKTNPQAAPSGYDMDALPSGGEAVSSLKIDRKAKEYYTVVRNVKTAHQIQEIGEYQEMDDDVEYILDALQPHNPTPTRCLSALQLATKCMTPAFRMHVRAHGVVTKFFKALSDANTDLSLGLCTSAIMYILSQEGLNMDLDRDSLELMMNLLESEGVAAPSDRANYDRNKQKVRELCEEIKAQGKATHLNVESITVGTLAMETLLSLTSKRAGEWFKEELRELGGLEHIIKTISDCCSPVLDNGNNGTTQAIAATKVDWTQPLLENMQTVARCMRVLENVTQINEENQKYMLTFSKGAAVNTLCTLYRLCDRELMLYPTTEASSKDNPGVVLRELLIPLMKVLINLTHAFNPASAMGAELLGQRADIFDISFHLLLQAPNYIPDRCIFELSMLVSLLLINLSMYTIANRTRIMRANAPNEFDTKTITSDPQHKTAVQAIMEYFYKCEEMARSVEKNTDAILDNTNKNKKKQEEVEETVNNLIQKAGHHMEHTLKGSYVAILIGYLITNSEENEAIVRRYLHSNGFKEIVSVLEKYYTFMNLTASSEAAVVAHIKSTKGIIDYFKKRDLVYEMNEDDDCVLPLNLETHPHSDSAGVSSAAIVSSSFTAHNNNNNLHSDGASAYFSPPIAASSSLTSSDVFATASASTSAAANATTTATSRNNVQRVYKTYSQR